MRKLLSLLVALLLLSVSAVSAAPPDMADDFPASTTVFISSRADTGFVDEIRTIYEATTADAPASVPVPPLDDLLALPIFPDISLNDLLEITGGDVAFGLYGTSPDDVFDGAGNPLFIADISDRAPLLEFWENELIGDDYERTEDNGTITYTSEMENVRIAVAEDRLTISSFGETDYLADGTLADDETYQKALNSLPDTDYNLLVYTSNTIIDNMGIDSTGDTATFADEFPAFIIAFDIQDERTLIMDTLTLTTQPPTFERIDMNFAGQVPAAASAMIHGTDLSGQIDTLNASIPNDLIQQIAPALQQFGIDLENDLLNWTTGDYALYLRISGQELADQIAPVIDDPANEQNTVTLDGTWDAGILLEATDPAAAQAFAVKLGNLAIATLSDTPFTVVEQGTLRDTDVTEIGVVIPAVPPLQMHMFTVSIGATDELFFIATDARNLPLFSRADGVNTNPAYQEALTYALPDPVSLMYADGEGVLLGTGAPVVGVLALLGPAINQVFRDVTEELENDGMQAPATRQTIQFEQQAPAVEPILDWILSMFSSGSISATVSDEGYAVSRFVLTYSDD